MYESLVGIDLMRVFNGKLGLLPRASLRDLLQTFLVSLQIPKNTRNKSVDGCILLLEFLLDEVGSTIDEDD